MGVHLTHAFISHMGMHLTVVHLTVVHLTVVHLTVVHLTVVHLTYRRASILRACISRLCISRLCISHTGVHPSYGRASILRACIHLTGVHPSYGRASILRACIHLTGVHPSSRRHPSSKRSSILQASFWHVTDNTSVFSPPSQSRILGGCFPANPSFSNWEIDPPQAKTPQCRTVVAFDNHACNVPWSVLGPLIGSFCRPGIPDARRKSFLGNCRIALLSAVKLSIGINAIRVH